MLGILKLLKYGIWDFVFERKLTWVERTVTACVKLLGAYFYPSPAAARRMHFW